MHELTVLMTTYNETEKVFCTAMDSILNQSIKDFFVLVIVDNPNNKEIVQKLDEYKLQDTRVSYVINEKNLGLPLSLNKGIDMINTEYIARMDADDIAEYDRLEKQLCFLKENKNVDVLGTNITYIDSDANILYKRNAVPVSYNEIKHTMKYVNVMSHPTFMGKTEVFKKYKYRNLRYAQDYDFVCRLLEAGKVVQNLPDYLLKYRQVETVNDKKIVRQKITHYCVQEMYSNGKLQESDIEKCIEKELAKINNKKLLKAIKLYDDAVIYLREGKKFKFLKNILISFCLSKYQRKHIVNVFKYKKISRRSNI